MQHDTKRRSRSKDAVTLLAEDHEAVDKLFREFERIAARGGDKAEIVRSACAALTVHAAIEEDVFYSALREAAGAGDDLDQAAAEHAAIRSLVSLLEEMEPTDEFYDATFTVLTEYVRHHVKQEESEMFAKARTAKLDLQSLGGRLTERKRGLGETGAEAAE